MNVRPQKSGSDGLLSICYFFYLYSVMLVVQAWPTSSNYHSNFGQVFYRLQLVDISRKHRPSPMPRATAHFDCDLDHDSLFRSSIRTQTLSSLFCKLGESWLSFSN